MCAESDQAVVQGVSGSSTNTLVTRFDVGDYTISGPHRLLRGPPSGEGQQPSPGSQAPITATIVVPANAPPGIYNIKINTQDTTGAPRHSFTLALPAVTPISQ
jgi:hypothetical protein